MPLQRFLVDLTGISPDNLINNEPHVLVSTPVRICVPDYGPFFTESIRVVDTATAQLLVKDTDYTCVELCREPTLRTGKEIKSLILITNNAVSNNISISYQLIGGDYTQNDSVIASLYNAVMSDNRPVLWGNVLDKPTEYPPTLHQHLLDDVSGFQLVIYALERITASITKADVYIIEYFMEWTEGRLNSVVNSKQGIVFTDKLTYHPNETMQVTIATRGLYKPTEYLNWTIEHIETVPMQFDVDHGKLYMNIDRGVFTVHISNLAVTRPYKFRIIARENDAGSTIICTSDIITIIT